MPPKSYLPEEDLHIKPVGQFSMDGTAIVQIKPSGQDTGCGSHVNPAGQGSGTTGVVPHVNPAGQQTNPTGQLVEEPGIGTSVVFCALDTAGTITNTAAITMLSGNTRTRRNFFIFMIITKLIINWTKTQMLVNHITPPANSIGELYTFTIDG